MPRRADPPPPPGVPPGISPVPGGGGRDRWREPAALLPLRWGTYRERLIGSLILIIGGGFAIAGANTYTLWLLPLGCAASFAGWAIVPADGWRRLSVAFPAVLCWWLLLAGPRFIGVLVVPFLAWLIVRHRPVITWLTLTLPVAGALVLGTLLPDYGDMAIVLLAECAIIAGAAWMARMLHRSLPTRPPSTPKAQRKPSPYPGSAP